MLLQFQQYTSSTPTYPTYTTETLASGAKKTITFTVSQSGGTEDDNNVKLTINSYEAYTGQPMESDVVYCNFMATIGPDLTTTLKVHVQDAASNLPVPAMQMSVQYPPSNGQTLTAFTDTNGNADVTLSTSGGGGYDGQVYIVTTATPDYPAQYVTATVHPGPNEVTITLNANTPPGFDWTWILLIVVVIVVIVLIATAIALSGGKRRKRK